jgi:hypothetical protein
VVCELPEAGRPDHLTPVVPATEGRTVGARSGLEGLLLEPDRMRVCVVNAWIRVGIAVAVLLLLAWAAIGGGKDGK